jgi:endonuclease/exonuclease/phosphatase family metal-dependent hydrolase
MTFNIWGGGLHRGSPLDETIAAIRAGNAEIVGLQEAYRPVESCVTQSCADNRESIACEIGRALGMHCHDQIQGRGIHGANAVLSRYPIIGSTESGLGVRINVAGQVIAVFNLHLPDFPYQPYQLSGIAYGQAPFLKTEGEAVSVAHATRGEVMTVLARELTALGESAAVITGDFNEPSFRDWTGRAAAVGLVPIPVAYPATRLIETMGFKDAYRTIHPDEIDRPGHTWTTLPAKRERHDRIDFIFARASEFSIDDAVVVGEKAPEADIVVTPWPSDHRAVLATIRLLKPSGAQLVQGELR